MKNKRIVISLSAIFIIILIVVTCYLIAKKQNEDTPSAKVATSVRTYQVLNIAESNNENELYLTIRKFQAEEVETIKVKKNLADKVQENQSYEFTFQYEKGTVQDNIKDILQKAELVSIIQTDKKGMEQRQDSIE